MLEKINQIFGDIKDAIQEKGVDIGDCESPETYADRIKMIKIASDSDCEGECCDGATGYVYYLFPVFKASATAPNTPSESANAIVLANEDNYITTLNYPSGGASASSVLTAGANSIRNSITPNPMWMSYCVIALNKGTATMFRNGTTPMCLGYPYVDPTTNLPYDNPNGGNSDNNKYYASKTFVVFTEMASSNVVPSRPTGGFGNIDTNQLTGNVVSTTSVGNIIWHTNYYRVSGTYTYVSIGTFDYNGNLIGTWSDPFCIVSLDGKNGSNGKDGRDGRDGADGVNIEFIYKRCTTLSAFRSLTAPESEIYITNHVPSGGTAQPTGIDGTNFKVEACCTRKLTSNGVGGEWQGPVIWAIGAGSGSGGSGGGDGSSSDNNGIVGDVEYWYQLFNQSVGITSPESNITDPSTVGWSKTPSTPTENYQYLGCFAQMNFKDGTFTRSQAYIIRKGNEEIAEAFRDFNTIINDIKVQLEADANTYQEDLITISNSLDNLRSIIQNQILATNLEKANDRISTIETTGVTEITGPGLGGKMTSYASDPDATEPQKSFADFLMNAKDANLTLETGSAFFNKKVTADLTLNGLDGRINAKTDKTYVDGLVASSTFKVSPELIQGIVSKGQAAGLIESTGELKEYSYGYDDFIANYDGENNKILTDYEDYMSHKGDYINTGHPEGPFKLATIVDEFSNIKQTADEISSSVTKYTYVGKDETNGTIFEYDAFSTKYDQYKASHSTYTGDYEKYCVDILGYKKIETAEALSNITQTNNQIKSEVGNINKVWRKGSDNDGGEYETYERPANKTVETYESDMESDGGSLYKWAPKLSTIDQTADAIKLTMSNSAAYWALKTNEDYSDGWKPYNEGYDTWLSQKDDAPKGSDWSTYEKYVAATQPSYKLIKVNTKISQIKQTADSIESSVSNVEGQVSTIRQEVDNIKMIVGSDTKVIYYSTENESSTSPFGKTFYPGGIYDYKILGSDYCTSEGISEDAATESDYENWLGDSALESKAFEIQNNRRIGGIALDDDSIMLGVGYGSGQYLSAIHIKQDDANLGLGKIILDAANTVVSGNLSAGIVESAFGKFNELDVTKAAISNLIADSVTAGRLESIDEGKTRRVLIEDGKAEFALWDSTLNNGSGGWRTRIDIGIDDTSGSNQSLVLRFFDANGTKLYNLGPAGFKDMNGQFIYEFDHNLD